MNKVNQLRAGRKKVLIYILCLSLLSIWSLLPQGMLSVHAAPMTKYVFRIDSTNISITDAVIGGTVSEYVFPKDNIASKQVLLNLVSDDGKNLVPVSGTSIYINKDSIDASENIVSVDTGTKASIEYGGTHYYDMGDSGQFTIGKVGPGTTTLSGLLLLDSGTISFNFKLKVPLTIKRDPLVTSQTDTIGYNPLFSNVGDDNAENRYLILPYPGAKTQVVLSGINEALVKKDPNTDPTAKTVPYNYSKFNLAWSTLDGNKSASQDVITVDDNGVVTAVGAGTGYVHIETIGDNKQSVDLKVVVPLRVSNNPPVNLPAGDECFDSGKLKDCYPTYVAGDKKLVINNVSGPTYIYTTLKYPSKDSEVKWVVEKDGKTANSTSYSMQFEDMDTVNGGYSRILFSASKAGNYTIKGFLQGPLTDDKLIPFKSTTELDVLVDYSDRELYMNIGDTYDILANTNIDSLEDFNIEVATGASIVSIKRGVITAKKSGYAVVRCTKNGEPDELLLTIRVVDSIKLVPQEATIYVGGTLDLEAYASSSAADIEWSVDNTTILSIESDGAYATIKGLKPGSAVVTVKQKVGGVTKESTCMISVLASVTSIKLTPAEAKLHIGESATFVATYTPNITSGVQLYWKSSDETIIKVTDENSHSKSGTVTAVAPGTAVVMAINKDNVVVGSAKVTVLRPVDKITLSETNVTIPQSAGKYQLYATVSPDTATNKKVNWTSSNPNVATVDANGVITVKKYGTVTIIAASDDKPSVMAMCEVTITQGVSGLTIDDTKLTMETGETHRLTYYVFPETANNRGVVFSSMDSKIASVDSTGLITAKSAGVTYITVTTVDGGQSQICTVKVEQVSTSLKLDTTKLVLDVGETYTLEPTFTPKTTTQTILRYASSDASVAKVDSKGRVTAVKAGTSIISVTTSNNITVFCYVTVNQPVTGIRLDYDEYNLYSGEEFSLTAEVLPSNATNQNVKWTSSNTAVATVDEEGTVKGLTGGVTMITCTTEEGGFAAVCMVQVVEYVAGMKLNRSSYKLGVGKKFTLEATVDNPAATDKSVKWVSSNPRVCTVSNKGVITGIKLGTAVITAYAKDGSEAEAYCEVTVVNQATGLTLNTSVLNLIVGESSTLRSSIRPSNATYSMPKYTSDNPDVAIVDSNGKVTAIGEGTCKITASAKDSSGLKAICVVMVRPYVAATGLTLSQTEVTMGIGATETISYSLKPNDSTDKVTWASNNRAVATVSVGSGIIKAISPGTAVVTARTSSGKTATVRVTVVGLNFTSYTMEQYDSYQLRVIGANGTVLWDVDNSDICTVVGGMVTGKKAGTTYVTARVNGASLRCRITVTDIRN